MMPSVTFERLAASAMDSLGLTQSARLSFPSFYANATPLDAELMDALVLAHAAFVITMNAPREHVAPALRAEVERATDAAERVFIGLREAVRLAPTFNALTIGEQLAIERVVFTVQPALFP